MSQRSSKSKSKSKSKKGQKEVAILELQKEQLDRQVEALQQTAAMIGSSGGDASDASPNSSGFFSAACEAESQQSKSELGSPRHSKHKKKSTTTGSSRRGEEEKEEDATKNKTTSSSSNKKKKKHKQGSAHTTSHTHNKDKTISYTLTPPRKDPSGQLYSSPPKKDARGYKGAPHNVSNNNNQDLTLSPGAIRKIKMKLTEENNPHHIAAAVEETLLPTLLDFQPSPKHSSMTLNRTIILRAPVPPGADDDDDDDGVMKPSHHHDPYYHHHKAKSPSSSVSASSRNHHHHHRHHHSSIPSSRRQSFTKAVAAAAVSDATVNGRPFCPKTSRIKEAVSALSSDRACSQYFQTMGQSFRPGSSPTINSSTPHEPNISNMDAPPHQKATSSARSSNNANPGALTNGSATGSASEAVRGVLTQDDASSNHELAYKVALLEGLFDDVAHSATATTTKNTTGASRPSSSHQQGNGTVDAGDAKVSIGGSSTRGRSHSKRNSARQSAAPPTRDIEQDPLLIRTAVACNSDEEKALLRDNNNNNDQEAPDGLTRDIIFAPKRKSSFASFGSMPGLFRIDEDNNNGRRRCLWLVFLGFFLIVGITMILTFTFMYLAHYKQQETQESALIGHPTLAPSSFQYDVLPWYTQRAFEHPSSPQSRAFYWLENDPNRPALKLVEAVQRFVLASLYVATNGDGWFKSGSWLDYPTSECQWYTHEFDSICDGAGQLHTLSLPGNSLQGRLPEELELLSHLNIVQLQNNQLTGTLPKGIWTSWTHLVYLNVYNNKLGGTIPRGVSFLAMAQHLNTLILRSNQFSGSLPPELGLLHLEFLSLSANRFTGSLPTELGLMSNVREMYLYDNQFYGTIPSTLGQLSKLTRLELHNNEFIGSVPDEICKLVSKGSLTKLTVDCEQVRCTCGCDCTASKDRRMF